MLFHILSEHVNIFRYLTFRSFGAAITSFLLMLIFTPTIINKLREMRFGQQVREEGPTTHLSKTGTPTMGGLFMWGFCIFSTLLWGAWNGFVLIVCLAVVLFCTIGFMDDYAKIKQADTKGLSPLGKLILQASFAMILLILVYMIPQYHQHTNTLTLKIIDNQGGVVSSTNVSLLDSWVWEAEYLSDTTNGDYFLEGWYYNPETGKMKMDRYFQIPSLIQKGYDKQIFSSTIKEKNKFSITTELTKIDPNSVGAVQRQSKMMVDIIYKAQLFTAFFVPLYTEVVWYWPLLVAFLFFTFIIVGVSNATNLSDGLDGLATGMGIGFYVPFGVFAYLIGNAVLSSYLFYPYIFGVGELLIFISAAIGAFVGFLWYNVHPAEIFMGDTGSLPMGAAISIIAIMLKQEVLLIIAGFMFVLETVSVILQVFWFKKFKKRIFKMAPIHHHFELEGWKENQVVVRFWIMGAFCAVLALATIKIR